MINLTSNLKKQTFLGILICFIVFRICAAFLIFKAYSGHTLFDGDSCSRILISWDAVRDFSLRPLTGDWLNLFFWIHGLFLIFSPDTLITPVIVNTLFSIGTLVVIYFLCISIFPEQKETAILSAGILAINPLSILLGMTALAVTSFYFFTVAAILLFVKYKNTGKHIYLFLCSAAFFINTGIRYEAWLFNMVFSSILIVDIFSMYIKNKKLNIFLVLAIILSWLFVLYHLIINKYYHGHIFAFLSNYSQEVTTDAINLFPTGHLAEVLRVVISNSLISFNKPLLIGALLGILYILFSKTNNGKYLIVFWFLSFFFIILQYYIVGAGNPWIQKTVHVHTILLYVFFSFALSKTLHLLSKNRSLFISIIIILLYFIFNFKITNYNPIDKLPAGGIERESARKIGILIKSLYKNRILDNKQNILLEIPVKPYGSNYSNIWNNFIIKVVKPENVIWDRSTNYVNENELPVLVTQDNQSVYDLEINQLKEYLSTNRIKIAIVIYPEAENKMNKLYKKVLKLKEYTFFIDKNHPELENALSDKLKQIESNWNNTIRYLLEHSPST